MYRKVEKKSEKENVHRHRLNFRCNEKATTSGGTNDDVDGK